MRGQKKNPVIMVTGGLCNPLQWFCNTACEFVLFYGSHRQYTEDREDQGVHE